MTFVKGQSGNPNGRKAGIPNKLTTTVRETVLKVFNDLQTDPSHNLEAFAKNHPKDFYLIASKLIPTEIVGETKQVIRIMSEQEESEASTQDESGQGDDDGSESGQGEN